MVSVIQLLKVMESFQSKLTVLTEQCTVSQLYLCTSGPEGTTEWRQQSGRNKCILYCLKIYSYPRRKLNKEISASPCAIVLKVMQQALFSTRQLLNNVIHIFVGNSLERREERDYGVQVQQLNAASALRHSSPIAVRCSIQPCVLTSRSGLPLKQI